MQIVFLDDEGWTILKELDIVEPILEKGYEIRVFVDPMELVKYCAFHDDVCLAIIDINLGEYNGIDIANRIKAIQPDIMLIYCSAHIKEHIFELINAESFRAIEKDEMFKLADAAAEAINRINSKQEGRLFEYTFNGSQYSVKLKDIMYFRSDDHRIIIKTIEGEKIFYQKLDELEENIIELDKKFKRINKSYIVNKAFIIDSKKKKVKIGIEWISITR